MYIYEWTCVIMLTNTGLSDCGSAYSGRKHIKSGPLCRPTLLVITVFTHFVRQSSIIKSSQTKQIFIAGRAVSWPRGS